MVVAVDSTAPAPPVVPGEQPGGSSAAAVPHLRIPLGLAQDGSLATVEQDSLDDITQCVSMLLGTLPGTRLMVPGYGLPDPTFGDVTPAQIQQLASTWEPRAKVDVTVTGSGRSTAVQVGVSAVESA